jgi:uncharacterized protein YfaS (alpha-2-macroglobulin family)
MVEKYYKGSATLNVSLSNQPPFNVKRLVQGLLDYPYGCAEQTTSAAYPHVFIDEAAAKASGLTPRTREQRAQFVEGAIGRLAGMQKSNGGFTLWGNGAYEVWISSYVYGFLQDARSQGFNVPDPMVKNAQDWLLKELQQAPNRFPGLPANTLADLANSKLAPQFDDRDYTLLRDSHQRFAELAYVGYMLARDQKAPLAMLRYLHDNVRDRARSPLPLIHLAIALKLMGDEPRAKVALNDAMTRRYGIQLKRYGWWGDEWLGDYGSPVRDLAMSYTLLRRHKIEHPQRENLLFDLADRLGSRNYTSTQERLALFLTAREVAATDTKGEWTVLLNGANSGVNAGNTAPEAITSKASAQRSIPVTALTKGVTLASQAKTALFVEVEAEGFPLKAQAPKADVIELEREWYEPTGQRWSGRPLKVGDLLIVKLAARSKLRIPDAMLVDRVPAGFEIENLNLSQGSQMQEFSVGGVNVGTALQDERIKHREYRDDRYVAAVRLEPGRDWLNVFYMIRVVSPGRFGVPAPYAEDMYRAELRAVGGATAPVQITDPRSPAAASAAAATTTPAAASVPVAAAASHP